MRLAVFPALMLMTFSASAQRPVDLEPSGEPRTLPSYIMGVNATPYWDDLIEDPAKIAAVKSMHFRTTRFPGGSESNYYDWHRGLFVLTPGGGQHSPYYQRFINLSQFVQRTHPRGITMDQYQAYSANIGAEVVMVPNMETSPVEDQVAWFKHLADRHAVPRLIELGNEFWVAMGQDPMVLRHWPDEPTAMQVMKRYLDAFRPYLPKDVKIAAQATVPSLRAERGGPIFDRFRQWNEHLHAEPWFDAVTMHFYPRLNEMFGAGAANMPQSPQIAMRNFRALMARVDGGTANSLRDVARRVPGKDIWITEWNANGGAAFAAHGEEQPEPTTPAMLAHLTTRMALAFLSFPRVTLTQFFSIRFQQRSPKASFLQGPGGYQPIPALLALRWLDEAANDGASFQLLTEPGAQAIAGIVREDSYSPIVGGLFRAGGRTTLIVQNASADTRTWKSGAGLKLGTPSTVERLALGDLLDPRRQPGRAESVPPSASVQLPAYSITRVIWNGGGPAR